MKDATHDWLTEVTKLGYTVTMTRVETGYMRCRANPANGTHEPIEEGGPTLGVAAEKLYRAATAATDAASA